MTDNPKPEWEWLEEIYHRVSIYEVTPETVYKDYWKLIAAVKLMKPFVIKLSNQSCSPYGDGVECQPCDAVKILRKLARGDL